MSQSEFIQSLRTIVGRPWVLAEERRKRPYTTGFRCGGGAALAVIRPRSLVALWQVLEACVAANKIIIMQAANTGLTGGSTPDAGGYDRDVVVVNTMAISKVHVIAKGQQVICLGGATLHELEKALKPYNREPHSVIGSSCIGASVIGGICNNSGGSLVRRGPAYTTMSLFARVEETGVLRLVNRLGVRLGSTPQAILERLERREFGEEDIVYDAEFTGADRDYSYRVRQLDASTPARFNADPRRLFDASGSAGRIAVFAVRLDTFPADKQTRTFYIGTNAPAELTRLRHHVLAHVTHLPVAGEYMHRDCFRLAAHYGRDSYWTIRVLGTQRLPVFFGVKRRIDGFLGVDPVWWTPQRKA